MLLNLQMRFKDGYGPVLQLTINVTTEDAIRRTLKNAADEDAIRKDVLNQKTSNWHLSGDIYSVVSDFALWKPEDMLDSISSNGHLELIWNFGKFSYWCTSTGIHALHAFMDIQNNVRHRSYECDKSELMKFQYVSITCRPSVQTGEGKKVKKKLLIYAYTRYNEFNMAGHDNANIILDHSVVCFFYCGLLHNFVHAFYYIYFVAHSWLHNRLQRFLV